MSMRTAYDYRQLICLCGLSIPGDLIPLTYNRHTSSYSSITLNKSLTGSSLPRLSFG